MTQKQRRTKSPDTCQHVTLQHILVYSGQELLMPCTCKTKYYALVYIFFCFKTFSNNYIEPQQSAMHTEEGKMKSITRTDY